MAADEPEKDLEWVRSRVLHVIGHELRTPVTTVRGLADALASESAAAPLSVDRAEVVGALQRNARRLEGLVDDLLIAGRVFTTLPVGDAEAVDLQESARKAWIEAAQGRGDVDVELDLELELDVELDNPEGGRAMARPESVHRILRHVLDNAAKYGTSPLTVRIYPSGSFIRIEIHSPGDELPAEDVLYATEPFWRGERAVTTAPGVGLGLAVAQTLIGHEGGALSVEARKGGGLLTVLEFRAA